MPVAIRIRRWRPGDARAVDGLFSALHPGVRPRRVDPGQFRAENRLLVAVRRGTVVGFAWVTRVRYHGAAVGYLEELVVAEGDRGQGLGRVLVRAAKRWLKSRGPLEVLFVAASGKAARFYRHLGFRKAQWYWTT